MTKSTKFITNFIKILIAWDIWKMYKNCDLISYFYKLGIDDKSIKNFVLNDNFTPYVYLLKLPKFHE